MQIDDSVEWTVRGDNALTGTYNGKQAVAGLWGEFGSKDFRTEPHDFIADGDKVVVLTTIHLDGETVESADILTYNGGGKLVAFETCSDAKVADRVFANRTNTCGGTTRFGPTVQRTRRVGIPTRRTAAAAAAPYAQPPNRPNERGCILCHVVIRAIRGQADTGAGSCCRVVASVSQVERQTTGKDEPRQSPRHETLLFASMGIRHSGSLGLCRLRECRNHAKALARRGPPEACAFRPKQQ